jgi:hypothetical protein
MVLIGQLALLVSSVFASTAFYINVVEQPARMGLDDRALLSEWKTAYRRGTAMQASLALLGFGLGILTWYLGGQLLFLIGALFMIANWPWTLVVMMPVNKKLMATPLEEAGTTSRGEIVKWSRLHAMRTVFGGLAVVALLLALLR